MKNIILEARTHHHVVSVVEVSARVTATRSVHTYRVFNCSRIAWPVVRKNPRLGDVYGDHEVRVVREVDITWGATTQAKADKKLDDLLQYAIAVAQAQQDKDLDAIKAIDWNVRMEDGEPLPILIDRRPIRRLEKAKVRVRYSLTGLAC